MRKSVVLSAWLALSLIYGAVVPAQGASEEKLRLVLVLVVDQLRRDRLDAGLPGGLGKLIRGGRVYRESVVDHGVSETCPGHAVVSTGRYPGRSGIPSNRMIDPENGETLYCVVDRSDEGRVLGHPEAQGRSPARLRVDALGDWMKAQRPETKVFSVSAKDRASVTLGGKEPDAAYWFQRTGRVGFATSRHYLEKLPHWVQEWNGQDPPNDGFLARVPERWEHSVVPPPRHGRTRADSFGAEEPRYSGTSSHRIHDDDLTEFADRLYHSPFVDDATLDFARHLIIEEGLGRGSGPDLLAVGLSATDLIGHFYGPESHEAMDGLLRLDAALGEFLAFLDDQLGPGRVLVALTSDHGVLPLPEWLELTDRGRCATRGGRADLRWLAAGMFWRLYTQLGSVFSLPWRWVGFAGSQVWVDRSMAREHGVPVERVMEVVAQYLREQDEIARVWTAADIQNGTSPEARLYRNSYDPARSGDLVIQLAEGCLLTPGDHGTTHGTPYLYDRAVPLLFYGPGVTPGVVDGPAASVDVAPTLAAQLGVSAPSGLDGKVLELGDDSSSRSAGGR